MTADTKSTFAVDAEPEKRFAALPPSQRALVATILKSDPHYRYDLSPPIFPQPEPGLASALAAVKTMVARIKSRLGQLDRIQDTSVQRLDRGTRVVVSSSTIAT